MRFEANRISLFFRRFVITKLIIMIKHIAICLILLLCINQCTKKTHESVSTNPQKKSLIEPSMESTKNEALLTKTEEQWKSELTPNEYHVLREKGTEPAFTGQYTDHKTIGIYFCKGCKSELFRSNEKFDSHCGWPSFYKSIDKSKINETLDLSYGMKRVEVTCSNCGGHLGHVFDDGPKEKTGLRYCINSIALGFMDKQVYDSLLKVKK